MMYVDYVNVSRDIIIDFVSLYLYAYGIIYYKYGNKELFVTCALFNIFILLVVMTIVRSDFNLAIGFGLFALLALVQMRSAPLTKTEMAYFFGSISLAVINGSGIADYIFVIMANSLIVISVWCISSWSIDHSANIFDMQFNKKITVVFDYIDLDATNDQAAMIEKLNTKFNMKVSSFAIKQIDYVKDTMEITMHYNTSGITSKRDPAMGKSDVARGGSV